MLLPFLKRVVPRRFLLSEVDAKMQILSTVDSLSPHVALEHVEGHQDTKHPDRPLSWAAELNQHCDTIASAHLDSATKVLKTVTFLR
jgi:hypothetical protein